MSVFQYHLYCYGHLTKLSRDFEKIQDLNLSPIKASEFATGTLMASLDTFQQSNL